MSSPIGGPPSANAACLPCAPFAIPSATAVWQDADSTDVVFPAVVDVVVVVVVDVAAALSFLVQSLPVSSLSPSPLRCITFRPECDVWESEAERS